MPAIDFNTPYAPFIPNSPKFLNLTGQRYGKFTVFSLYGRNSQAQATWLCRCNCGNFRVVFIGHLRSGHTVSCGCIALAKIRECNSTHGASGTPEYATYKRAKGRCRNPQTVDYARYGGRGIEFRFTSFEEFFESTGKRPSNKYSLDRINNDGHYEKGNIRWATRTEQARNTRRNHLITFEGQTRSLAEWCERRNMNYHRISQRLRRHGWCIKCAFSLINISRCVHEHSTARISTM